MRSPGLSFRVKETNHWSSPIRGARNKLIRNLVCNIRTIAVGIFGKNSYLNAPDVMICVRNFLKGRGNSYAIKINRNLSIHYPHPIEAMFCYVFSDFCSSGSAGRPPVFVMS